MTIEIKDDRDNIGYAILSVVPDPAPGQDLWIAIQFVDGSFLAPNGGRLRREDHFFVRRLGRASADAKFRIGPEITRHVRQDETVTFRTQAGQTLGTLTWDNIRPPLSSGAGAIIKPPAMDPVTTSDATKKHIDPVSASNVNVHAQPDLVSNEIADQQSSETPPEPQTVTPPPVVPPEEHRDDGTGDKLPLSPEGATGGGERLRRWVFAHRALMGVTALALLLILIGAFGWDLDPPSVVFVGPAVGPFRPTVQTVTLRQTWPLRPLESWLFLGWTPFDLRSAPSWLRVTQTVPERSAEEVSLSIRVAGGPDLANLLRQRPSGEVEAGIPLRLPWWLNSVAGPKVTLRLESPRSALVIETAAPLTFRGPAGGPFAPAERSLTLFNAGNQPIDWTIEQRPPWLDLRMTGGMLTAGARVTIGVAPNGLANGLRAAVDAALLIRDRAVAATERRSVRIIMTTQAGIDDEACDRLAGNRFDDDHPASRGFTDDVARLSLDDIEDGMRWCDGRENRIGADRRFLMQRGRLLAERAVRFADQGEGAAAEDAMRKAVAAWRVAEQHGSAYAQNLLGAYYKGTFNRPRHTFVEPDDALADDYWNRAMRAGNLVAKRNYASQLLSGLGMPPDVGRALTLLRELVDRDDARSAGILGVALYKGAPQGVTQDQQQGWSLIVKGQCADFTAQQVLMQEIQSGARRATDRRAC